MHSVEGFENTKTYTKVKKYTTHKFELLPESTSENAPKNLLFGEGEFIIGDKLHVFIMADLYVIGANLYAATNKASDMSYNVYIGDSVEGEKALKFKLGELKRSQDGRYKLEFNSSSKELVDLIKNSNYIQVRLEDVQKTLNTLVLESTY